MNSSSVKPSGKGVKKKGKAKRENFVGKFYFGFGGVFFMSAVFGS